MYCIDTVIFPDLHQQRSAVNGTNGSKLLFFSRERNLISNCKTIREHSFRSNEIFL